MLTPSSLILHNKLKEHRRMFYKIMYPNFRPWTAIVNKCIPGLCFCVQVL